jgi:hypothetical protein
LSELSSRIQRLTHEINELMRDLSANDDAKARELAQEVLGTETAKEFKDSVDAMRHLIWLFIEASACLVNDATPSEIESQRLQRAANLLKSLHGDSIPAHLESGDSFMERVQRIVSEAASR